MPAFGIRPNLRLVERGKGDVTVNRHRFGSAQQPAGTRWQDFLFAGQQPDLFGPLQRHDPVINLARQQSQREAHHAARMPAHPLDREMRLAGVGRAEHSSDRGTRVRHWPYIVRSHDLCNS
jgi:hypothetical protein